MIGRNYWHVYNHMRRMLMANGHAPERDVLLVEFADLSPDEVDEGIAEFDLAIGKRKRGEAG